MTAQANKLVYNWTFPTISPAICLNQLPELTFMYLKPTKHQPLNACNYNQWLPQSLDIESPRELPSGSLPILQVLISSL
jgi:hypothetical protein